MNFNIVFRLLVLTIRLLKRLSKTNKHIGIKKTFINREKFYQISFSLWIYAFILSIILSLFWVIGSQISNEIINISFSKFHNIFNSKLALISFFFIIFNSMSTYQVFKREFIIFHVFIHNIVIFEHTRYRNMRCLSFQ